MKKSTPPIDIEKDTEEIVEKFEDEIIPCSPPKITRKHRALAFSFEGRQSSGDWNFYIKPPEGSTADDRRSMIEEAIHKESERRRLQDEERKRIQEAYAKKGYGTQSRPPSRALTEEERKTVQALQEFKIEDKKKNKP